MQMNSGHVVHTFQTPYEAFTSRFESRLGKHSISSYWSAVTEANRAKDVAHHSEGRQHIRARYRPGIGTIALPKTGRLGRHIRELGVIQPNDVKPTSQDRNPLPP